MTIREVWVQRSDFSADSFQENLNEKMALDKFKEFPWREEIDRYINSTRSRKKCCPPGIGFVAKSGAILHVFATSHDGFLVSHPSRTSEQHVQVAEVPTIIKEFWEIGSRRDEGTAGRASRNSRDYGWLTKAPNTMFATALIASVLFLFYERELLKFLFIPWGLVLASMVARAFVTGTATWGPVAGSRKRSPVQFWFIVIMEIVLTVAIMAAAILVIVVHG